MIILPRTYATVPRNVINYLYSFLAKANVEALALGKKEKVFIKKIILIL